MPVVLLYCVTVVIRYCVTVVILYCVTVVILYWVTVVLVCCRTGDQGEALYAGKVSVLDGHDAGLGEQLLWVVVDQLPGGRNNSWGSAGGRTAPFAGGRGDCWLALCCLATEFARVYVCVRVRAPVDEAVDSVLKDAVDLLLHLLLLGHFDLCNLCC